MHGALCVATATMDFSAVGVQAELVCMMKRDTDLRKPKHIQFTIAPIYRMLGVHQGKCHVGDFGRCIIYLFHFDVFIYLLLFVTF